MQSNVIYYTLWCSVCVCRWRYTVWVHLLCCSSHSTDHSRRINHSSLSYCVYVILYIHVISVFVLIQNKGDLSNQLPNAFQAPAEQRRAAAAACPPGLSSPSETPSRRVAPPCVSLVNTVALDRSVCQTTTCTKPGNRNAGAETWLMCSWGIV